MPLRERPAFRQVHLDHLHRMRLDPYIPSDNGQPSDRRQEPAARQQPIDASGLASAGQARGWLLKPAKLLPTSCREPPADRQLGLGGVEVPRNQGGFSRHLSCLQPLGEDKVRCITVALGAALVVPVADVQVLSAHLPAAVVSLAAGARGHLGQGALAGQHCNEDLSLHLVAMD